VGASYIHAGKSMRQTFLPRILVMVLAAAAALLGPSLLDVQRSLVVLMVMLAALILGLGIWYRPERQLPFLCDPMVLVSAFQAQFFVIGPLCLPLMASSPLFEIPAERVVVTLALFLLLQGSFIAGYQSRMGVVLSEVLPDFRRGRIKLPGRWIETLTLAGSALGCAAFVLNLGGLDYILRLGYGQGKSPALFQLAFQALILGTLLMAWRLINSKPTRPLDVALFLLVLAIEVVFFAVILGARKRLFFLFFGLFSVWLLRFGKSRLPRRTAALIMVLLLVFFSVWGTVRSRPLRELAEGSSLSNYAALDPVNLGYLFSVAEPFAVACMVVELFPDTEPYRYGGTLVVTLLGFIPRAVWPDKPVSIGKELTRYTDGVYYDPVYGHGLAPTLVGDYYANLGLLGVLLGGLGFGILCRTVAAYASKGMLMGCQTSPARVLVAAVFLAGLVEVRGDLASILAFYGITYPFLLLALLFFRLDYDRSIPEPA